MKIEAIHTAMPKTHNLGGTQKFTSIVKQPVLGPIMAGPLGLEGDAPGNTKYHGGEDKAIYAYGLQHYTQWQSEFPALAFPVGIFGENLVIDSLDEHQLWVGDTFKIGAVVVQLSTPRIPCATLSARVGDREFVKAFTSAERPGVYLRVLEGGTIETGMAWELVSRGVGQLTMAEAFRMYLGGNTESLKAKAAAEPTLPQEWKDKLLS